MVMASLVTVTRAYQKGNLEVRGAKDCCITNFNSSYSTTALACIHKSNTITAKHSNCNCVCTYVHARTHSNALCTYTAPLTRHGTALGCRQQQSSVKSGLYHALLLHCTRCQAVCGHRRVRGQSEGRGEDRGQRGGREVWMEEDG